MDVRTYRARSVQEALMLVRRELGPKASVLQTREVRCGGLLRLLPGLRQVEVTASVDVGVPSRLPARPRGIDLTSADEIRAALGSQAISETPHRRPTTSATAAGDEYQSQLSDLHAMFEVLCKKHHAGNRPELPESLFQLFTDLIEADVAEDLARELIDRVRADCRSDELSDTVLLKVRVARAIEEQMLVSGPIRITGPRRVVALVGPTGVGKTTTVAKLAANFRLREKRRVGLITVDTYRIAAVEQLRTYADIMDLPMAVVSTPREMREAVLRMNELELVLVDTAGRSPRDDVKIQELKSMIGEAQADEVHLVLSCVGSATTLTRTAEQFATAGVTNLVLTKLDEATGLGNVLPLLRSSRLPLSYLTNGQNVPDDIRPADARILSRTLLGMGEPSRVESGESRARNGMHAGGSRLSTLDS